MNKTNIAYLLYTNGKEPKKINIYLRELVLSIWCLTKFSGLESQINIFLGMRKINTPDKLENYVLLFMNKLKEHNIISNIHQVQFIPNPWCTKLMLFLEACKELHQYLYIDTDVKFIKKIDPQQIFRGPLKFGYGIQKSRLKYKGLKKFIKRKLGVNNFKGNIGGCAFAANTEDQSFDWEKYYSIIKKYSQILSVKNYHVKKLDDQVVFSAALLKMGHSPDLKEFRHDPGVIDMRHCLYYIHNHNLESHSYSFKEAKKWVEEICGKEISYWLK